MPGNDLSIDGDEGKTAAKAGLKLGEGRNEVFLIWLALTKEIKVCIKAPMQINSGASASWLEATPITVFSHRAVHLYATSILRLGAASCRDQQCSLPAHRPPEADSGKAGVPLGIKCIFEIVTNLCQQYSEYNPAVVQPRATSGRWRLCC